MKASLSEWKEFLQSAVYADITNEIDERRALIIPKLVAGNDTVWTDDNMRGRLDELEFIATMAEDVVKAIDMEAGKSVEKESFMDSVFNAFKLNKETGDR